MSSRFEPNLSISPAEPVERRGEPRGPIAGLVAVLPAAQTAYPVLEAGLSGMFVQCPDIARHRPGATFDVTLSRDELSLRCAVEVVRIEREQRRGYALKIVEMSAESARIFESMRS